MNKKELLNNLRRKFNAEIGKLQIEQVKEMGKRRINHNSSIVQGISIFQLFEEKKTLWQPVSEQVRLLKEKDCKCKV